MKFRFLTSGESHGKCLNAIIEGIPAGFKINIDFINDELSRRQKGYGRGARMQIETDKVEILSGVRLGLSTGAPICLKIENKDWQNWQIPMSIEEIDLSDSEILQKIKEKEVTKLRPGHADYAGAIKYAHNDIRNVLERSSARETATRVAVGAVAKCILGEFGIKSHSNIVQVGNVTLNEYGQNFEEKVRQEIDNAGENGDSLGGKFEVIFENLPVGLGSFVHWDRKLDGLIAQVVMSIPAVKSVEIGLGVDVACTLGSKTHDEIFYEEGKIVRKTNNAGGIEGGMTNGEPIVVKACMKAIPTMKKPLNSIDLNTKQAYQAHFERADICAVEACAVVAESMVAIILTECFLEKFGGDSLKEMRKNYG